MRTITTYFLPPTETLGPRYKASTVSGQSLTIDQIDSLSDTENHLLLAEKLANKLNWHGNWYGGSTKQGYIIWVNVELITPKFSVRFPEEE